MAYNNIRKQDSIIAQKGLIYALLFMGLMVLTYAILFQKWLIVATVICSPIALLVCLYGIQHPMASYLMYCTIAFYFSAIYRYANIEGLSGLLEVFLYICFVSIFINIVANKKTEFDWKNTFNVLTVGYFAWLVFCLLEMFNPHVSFKDPIKSRGVFTTIPLSYILSSVLLCSPKKLRNAIILIGIFIITAAMKLYWQKTQGWDHAEIRYLVLDEAWRTHLLRDGVRYFSFFTDAGNFGAIMGLFTISFGLITIALKSSWLRWFCLGVTILAGTGLIMSGTRGAIVIPFAGLLLYLLLSKNSKAIIISTVLGISAFCFFAFTDIGDNNAFIRRTRTAFRPSEDASFNVRLENQKRFAYYLKDKPFGVGIGGRVVDTEQLMNNEEDHIPTDSFYVDVWVENGIVGLCIYLLFIVAILLRCCYIILFKIQHIQLRNILIAMLAGVFGLWINGYVGRSMGAMPGILIIPIFLSFILNGPYIEKQMLKDTRF